MRRLAIMLSCYVFLAPVDVNARPADSLLKRARITTITTSLIVPVRPDISPPVRSAQRPQASKRKAIIIGAVIGAGAGAGVGAVYCQADCGGGPARGVLVFAPIGASIGAAAGLVIALLSGR